MKLYFVILNYVIFDFLKYVHSSRITHNEQIGVSEKAIKKLQELKKIELDYLIGIAKNNMNDKDVFKKYHCISSDYVIINKKDETNPENNNNKQNKESESSPNNEDKKPTSFINKMLSFLGNFDYRYKNNISPEKIDIQEYKNKEERNSISYNEEKNEIVQDKKANSYMQLKGFSLIKKNMLVGKKDPGNNVEIGNFGSFYAIFGENGTDYPWACSCDPKQLKEYKEEKRTYVLCHNQRDTSIQNSDLHCNPDSSFHFNLSFVFIFLIIVIHI